MGGTGMISSTFTALVRFRILSAGPCLDVPGPGLSSCSFKLYVQRRPDKDFILDAASKIPLFM